MQNDQMACLQHGGVKGSCLACKCKESKSFDVTIAHFRKKSLDNENFCHHTKNEGTKNLK